MLREQRRPTKAELFDQLGLSPPARTARTIFGSGACDIESSPEIASRPQRLVLVDAGTCQLYRFALDGSKEIATMKAGKHGFLEGWFGSEGPLSSEIPNILLQLPSLPIVMKRPAAAPKRKPQQKEELEDSSEEKEKEESEEEDEEEEQEGEEEEEEEEDEKGEEDKQEDEEEQQEEDEGEEEEEDLEQEGVVPVAAAVVPLDVTISFWG